MITNEIAGKQSLAETFSPGQVIGEHLTLKQKLSTGDIGTLWLARDAESDKDVALLFLPGVLLSDSRVMEELRAQVKLNRQLIHPQVLRTHDFIEEEGWAAISSDAVEAGDLASLLAKKERTCFEPSEVQGWLSTICQALDDAHRAGLLHRDLVPRNILLTKNGGTLIANFGISRIILDALGRVLGRGKIDEHVASMSPQQLDGEYPARWDDIYSLGALIYQLLTGKPLFDSGDILPQIRKSVPPSIAARLQELGITGEPIPESWEKVVAACLEKHTPQRPKSAREVGVKLGGEISLASQVQAVVRAVTAEPAAEPEKKREPAKVAEVSHPAPAKDEVKAPSTENGEREQSLAGDPDDIVWRKPVQRPQAAPGEPPSFKHLLETVPGEQAEGKPFPLLKVAGIAACVLGLIGIIYFSTRNKPQQNTATTTSSITPAPAASAPKSTPQIGNSGNATTPPPQANVTGPGKTDALEQERKNVQNLQSAVEQKTAARKLAETDYASAKSALDTENTVLDGLKKTAADTAILLKQREDEAAKATADAAKATDDLKAAQKAADEKAAALAAATKAKEQVLGQSKDQQTQQQNEAVKLEALQKTATDKQTAADAAGNAEKDARSQLQVQQDVLKKAEAAAGQPSSTPASTEPVISPTTPSGTMESIIPITGTTVNTGNPTKTPTPVSVASAEAEFVKNIEQSHQLPTGVTPPPQPQPTAQPDATPTAVSTYVDNPNSQIDRTHVNSLGMKFQPVGNILFCVWLTRVQDFEVFARETHFKDTNWLQPGFKQGPDHPVVYVTWNDATAFCKWLTDKERKAGLLAPNQLYRLPTDLEWSKAVGLPDETGKTPDERDVGIKDVYPWGTEWPPPNGAGNYDGEETDSEVSIKGYNDGFVYTSPVGSFAANKFGLYDMGGNAWEWCLDWYNGEQKQKVLRGASWYNGDLQLSLLSSCRWPSPPEKSSDNFGFRCVIATEGGKPKR